MIRCEGCGKEISKKAKACPNCGEPVPKTSLFTWLFLIILICILFISIQDIETTNSSTKVSSKSITSKTNTHKKAKAIKEEMQKLIPRSHPEKCKYYLVYSRTNGNIKRVVSKQVCPKNKYYNGISFSIIDISCKNKEFKYIGYGENDISHISLSSPSRWVKLVDGSSKADLVNFVCK